MRSTHPGDPDDAEQLTDDRQLAAGADDTEQLTDKTQTRRPSKEEERREWIRDLTPTLRELHEHEKVCTVGTDDFARADQE